MDYSELVSIAREVLKKSYSPYSHFKVGAVVVGGSGKVYSGTNVENASYGATVCAERIAIFKAVSEGETSITAVVIASEQKDFIYPCGMCCQVMAEFAGDELPVICSTPDGKYVEKNLSDFLPFAFRF